MMRDRCSAVLTATLAVLLGTLVWAGAAAAAPQPGTLDGSFGSGGIVSVSGTQLLGVAVQSDGNVIAAGASGDRVVVQQYSGIDGHLINTYTGPGGYARAVTIAPNGDIVIAGSLVERLTANLTPDPSFGSGGVAAAQGAANGVAVGQDGSVAVAGTLGGEMAVSRYNAAGTRLWTESRGGPNSAGNGVAVQPDGRIVAVGRQTPSQSTNAVVVRLNSSNGSLDSTFRGGGAFTYYCSGTGYTEFTSVTLQSDGKIVAGGDDAAGPYAVFARFNSDGSADQGFGGGGSCPNATTMPAGQSVTVLDNPVGAYGMAIADGGRIVGAGGFENTGVQMDAAAWALTSGGAPEPTFGVGGTVRGPQGTYEGCAIAVAPDGSLVSVGDTVTSFSTVTPCMVGASSGGFVTRRIGFGPPSRPPPASGPPVVSTGAATAASEVAATVSGQVNPKGLATTYHFDFGKTTSYGSSTRSTTLTSIASSAAAVSARITGLRPGTTYHYRVVAHNADGTTYGRDRAFKTLPRLQVKLLGVSSSYRTSVVAQHGLVVSVSCSQPCSISGSLVIPAATARRRHLGTRPIVLGGAAARLARASTTSLRLQLSGSGKRTLPSAGTINVTLGVTGRPIAGGPPASASKTVTFIP